jgi:hypothetical protein
MNPRILSHFMSIWRITLLKYELLPLVPSLIRRGPSKKNKLIVSRLCLGIIEMAIFRPHEHQYSIFASGLSPSKIPGLRRCAHQDAYPQSVVHRQEASLQLSEFCSRKLKYPWFVAGANHWGSWTLTCRYARLLWFHMVEMMWLLIFVLLDHRSRLQKPVRNRKFENWYSHRVAIRETTWTSNPLQCCEWRTLVCKNELGFCQQHACEAALASMRPLAFAWPHADQARVQYLRYQYISDTIPYY